MSQKLERVSRGETYAGYSDLTVLACASCGVTYAIPTVMRDEAYRLGHRKIVWYCPNGHEMGFNDKSYEERLREEAQAAQAARVRAVAERDQAKAEARTQKGRATRFRNDRDRLVTRARNGVCPCCGRTFKQLARHMAAKHPDWQPS